MRSCQPSRGKQVRNYVAGSTEWMLQTTERLNNHWVVSLINFLVVLRFIFGLR
jgi:hypothetical protein